MEYVFGPVPSRRLGLSLSGSGEPTLNLNIGYLIKKIKRLTDIPVAVLTNGSLFYDEDLCSDLSKVDIVIPSLDAGNKDSFLKINRPCESMSFEIMVSSLKSFSKRYRGELWLEVMLIDGFNNSEDEIKELNSIVSDMVVDKIQLNTVERPPAEGYAKPIDMDKLDYCAGLFDRKVEIIKDFSHDGLKENELKDIQKEIENLLERRPCTIRQLAGSLLIHDNEVIKYVNLLLKNKKAVAYRHKDKVYYKINKENIGK